MLTALETRLQVLRHQPLDAARHLTGAKVLTARLYGVGPVTALAMTLWLVGAGRFPSVRKAVRSPSWTSPVYSSECKRSRGRCPARTRGRCARRFGETWGLVTALCWAFRWPGQLLLSSSAR